MPDEDRGTETTPATTGWVKGHGWGWIWGPEDELGALNDITAGGVLSALRTVREGRVYDLGVTVNRSSFLSPFHVHTELVAFRTPEGAKRQRDVPVMDPRTNTKGLSFMTGLAMLSDHAGTQIDGLAHITSGEDDHWYNGFRVAEWGGDFGPRKASADTTPPIILRGVLLDVAAFKGIDVLPDAYPIGIGDLEGALARQKVAIEPGSAVFVRTGSLSRWGTCGADHEQLAGPDSSGLTLASTRWLVEEQGAILVGTDTSMVEVFPNSDGDTWHPVHEYLLVEQGVHMGELHYLEDLSRDGIWTFCYIALLPKLEGITAGFAMRPIAIV